MISAFFITLKKIKHVLYLIFLFGIFSDIFLLGESSDLRTFPLLILYVVLCIIYPLKSKATFIFDFFILVIIFSLFITTGTSINTEKAAVWWVLFLGIGLIQQWRELSVIERNSTTKIRLQAILLSLIKKISSSIYSVLGPVVSFKLAMSPIGRLIFSSLAQKDKLITIKTKYGFWMELNLYEYLMSGYFFMGETNPYETKILRKMLKKGDVFFDVGAHIGWYSLVASQIVEEKGYVISFEPNPSCVTQLEVNKDLNKFDNLEIAQIALADKNTTLDFWIGDDMGGSLIKKNTERLTLDKKVEKVSVQTSTLDSYCETHKIKKITLMKIDVEGAEMQVLKGAKKILQSLCPDLIIEATDDTLKENNTSKKELFSFLNQMGYFAYEFTAKGLKPYTVGKPQETINIYFSTKKI